MTAAEQIRAELIRAARGLGAPEDVDPLLERPRETSHGDLATNLAMVLAKPLRSKPRDIAERLRDAMKLDRAGVSKIDIAGPGFMGVGMVIICAPSDADAVLSAASAAGLAGWQIGSLRPGTGAVKLS